MMVGLFGGALGVSRSAPIRMHSHDDMTIESDNPDKQ